MRFCSPIARSDLNLPNLGLPSPVRSAFRLSQPHSGLLLKSPWGLVSCPWHLWGSPFRAFPLETVSHSYRERLHLVRSTFPNSQPPACLQESSKTALARKQVRLSKYTNYKVFFSSQVRSHLVSVLPFTSGRCSLGLCHLIEKTTYKLWFNKSQSHYGNHSCKQVQLSIRVWWIRLMVSPERETASKPWFAK
jgi:hypothetical protein